MVTRGLCGGVGGLGGVRVVPDQTKAARRSALDAARANRLAEEALADSKRATAQAGKVADAAQKANEIADRALARVAESNVVDLEREWLETGKVLVTNLGEGGSPGDSRGMCRSLRSVSGWRSQQWAGDPSRWTFRRSRVK